uniref:Uncharacterized protein n=1 Tax=Pithovirus LCPAC302 TaxID=2506593 RepID=A0A481Z8S4_9VIRU|nr:MAG: uncharacterized protein LCPAC302_01290 [Pithovirus LCPAC302]
MFSWDGSDISSLLSNADIYETKYNKIKYWLIQYEYDDNIFEEVCIARSCKYSTSCLIDELKPIFGLQKLGTHRLKYKNGTMLLIKCARTGEGYIKEELNLNKIDTFTPLLVLQIQEIFAFRELLGVTRSFNSSIILRESKRTVYPVSFYDPNMLTTDKKIIPFSVLERWFKNTTIDEVVKRILKVRDINKLSTVLHNLRNQIEEVINRVDRTSIFYKNCIMNRITERLQTSLDNTFNSSQ